MSPVTVGILGCCLLLVLLFLGMPITFVMMFVGFTGIWFLSGIDAALPIVASTLYETVSHYPFTIIPLFVLMGGFADNSGITTRLYDTFDKWFRRLPGWAWDSYDRCDCRLLCHKRFISCYICSICKDCYP